ncbi:MAG: type II toxin-antitoxin system RelE/ParE family toxin [Pyrinomonadaceae bacterium]
MKGLKMHGQARETIRGFSKSAKTDIGELLRELQDGETPAFPDSRPMPIIERGSYELRVRDADGIYRVFYYLKAAEYILVFHAFTKKTRTTPQSEIETGRRRLWQMLKELEPKK